MDKQAIGAHKQALGLMLRRLRNQRNLSQAELASATGISSSFLSLVEQGRSDITIGRLLRLAKFYDIELTDLLGDLQEPRSDDVILLRPDPEHMIHSDAEKVDLFDLTAGTQWTLVPILGVHQPNAGVEVNDVDGRESIMFVLDGVFEIQLDGRAPVRLRRGESAIFRWVAPFRLWNVSKRTGRLLGISLRHRPPQ
jgi:transcriptional regulator with XRE-family HTH domain